MFQRNFRGAAFLTSDTIEVSRFPLIAFAFESAETEDCSTIELLSDDFDFLKPFFYVELSFLRFTNE